MKIYYRLGATAEKNLFKEMGKYYDGIVINANFFALYDSMVPSLLKKIEKPFFFDPKTFVFGRPLECIEKEDGEMRASFKELRKYYGEKLRSITDERQLLPKDFMKTNDFNEEFIEGLATKVLSFQEDLYPRTNTQKSLETYSEILNKDLLGKERKQPAFLVPPYFYFQSLESPWYDISLRLAKTSVHCKPSRTLYAPICTSKEVISNKKGVKKIVEAYKEFDGFLLWISDMDESRCTVEQLRHFKYFIQQLGKLGKPIYNLYGRLFSTLLNTYGLTGLVRGINYGSHRDIDQKPLNIEGWPTRYFLPCLETLTTKEVADTFYSDFPEKLCDCEICNSIQERIHLHGENLVEAFFKEVGITETRKHFMAVYRNEFQTFSQLNQQKAKNLLEKKYRKGKELEKVYGFSREHLKRWEKALTT